MLVRMRLLGFARAFAVLNSICAVPGVASAYCRTTTVESVSSSCPEICQEQGDPLYWPRRQLSYVLNKRSVPGLSDGLLRALLRSSFDTWLEAECEQMPIDLFINQSAQSSSLEAGPKELEPNPNVIAYISAEAWEEDPLAFAITKIWYSDKTAHILGADMLLNGGMGPFGECPSPVGCQLEKMADLRNVITHEAGHFLGLAHSDDPSSTMWCNAAKGEVQKRSLADDDLRGICAIYGPDVVPGPPASDRTVYSYNALCTVAPWRGGARFSALGLFVVLVLLGLRRRAHVADRPKR